MGAGGGWGGWARGQSMRLVGKGLGAGSALLQREDTAAFEREV